MTLLPIVRRELRVAARRPGTYWLRCGAALVVIILGASFFALMHSFPQRELAIWLFRTLTACAVLFSLLSGGRSTADCLSAEKREGTLGLLFLTDLKGYDVVLGKLAATSVNILYSVLAVMPMLAVPLLLGGVTLGEFGRMSVVALNALFLSLAVGIFVSSLSRSSQKASATVMALLLLFTVFLPFAGAMLAAIEHTRGVNIGFLLPSVGYSYFAALDLNYRATGEGFWYSALAIQALGWCLLLAASIFAQRTWQERVVVSRMLRWRERWLQWSYGGQRERTEFRHRLLSRNAFFWLAARARLKPAMVWSFLVLVACGWVWGLAKYHRDWLNEGAYVVSGVLLSTVLRVWFTGEASRPLAEERQAGTLEMLLSTPLRVRDILRGQQMALLRQFLGPVLVVLVAEALFLVGSRFELDFDEDYRAFWIVAWLIIMLLLLADFVAIFWVGLWQGLTAKTPSRATSGTLARIFAVPAIGFGLLFLVRALVELGFSRGSDPSWQFVLGSWFLLRLIADLGFGASARRQLLTQFRLVAQQRFERQTGFWKRILSRGEGAASPASPGVRPRE